MNQQNVMTGWSSFVAAAIGDGSKPQWKNLPTGRLPSSRQTASGSIDFREN